MDTLIQSPFDAIEAEELESSISEKKIGDPCLDVFPSRAGGVVVVL